MGSRRCGRPTTTGAPCRALVGRFDMACRKHSDDRDREIAKRLSDTWSDGFRSGCETGRRLGIAEVNRIAKQAGLVERERRLFRTHEGERQIVRVDRYAYVMPFGIEAKIGDRVFMPANEVVRHAEWGTVTALGTTYDGELREVLSHEAL